MTRDPHALPDTPVRRVVIAGGGTAGWMAAAAISKILGKELQITLVESEQIGTVGVGEATIPPLVTFHRLMEIDERAFMAATQGAIKLGILFEHWREIGHRYFHSFGTTGRDHWTAGFQHFWLRGRDRGLASDYADYNVESVAAREKRFAHLPNMGMNYAYHFDASLYGKFMRGIAEQHGVRRVEGKIVEVALHEDTGCIRSLRLESGDVIEGDLFIDCTGFRALLIDKALGVEFEDWSHWLFNDSALAVQTAAVEDAAPYTSAIAEEAGWQWRIPLQRRVGNGIVYASQHMDDARAREIFEGSLRGEHTSRMLQIRFRPGRRVHSWYRNCIALGLSGSFIEPLESTTIHLIQRGITRLMQCFPKVLREVEIAEYNRQMAEELVHVRDFVVLHYALTDRRDTAYWRACHEMTLPPSLQHRIDLFRETGIVFHQPNELFAENSWIQVMMGQGNMPRQHHPTADLMGDAELTRFLNAAREHASRTAAQLPSHQAYLDRWCPAAPQS
jgi:tryptophan halogenase